MPDRYGPEHLDAWRRDGVAVIHEFFTPEEVAAVGADFQQVFGRAEGGGAAMVKTRPGELGRFNSRQFTDFRAVPLDCSPALNLIGVHPALIAFAKATLGSEDVHLYQCQAWAKFTGDADYDQPFHCDYSNHTLVAPAEDAHLNSIAILSYFSDVTETHGAMGYVTRPDSDEVAGPEATLSFEPGAQARLQEALRKRARSSAGPAGTIVPYGIDVYHRGVNLTEPQGHRYTVTSCFKAAGNDAIGYHAWPFHHLQPWARIFDHATPEQLACFGVHRPGHRFWTRTTLARAQARYPNWDLTPWREALA